MASLLKWHVRPSVDTPALGRVSTSGSGALISAAHINLRSCKGSNCSCCCCSSSLSSPSRLLSSSLVSSRNSRTLRTNLPDFYHLKRKRTRGNSHIEALVKGVDYEVVSVEFLSLKPRCCNSYLERLEYPSEI